MPSSESELWAWLSALDAPPPESLAAAAQSRLPPGVRIAAGRPAAGLAGFRTTHAEAVAAARVAVLAADDAPALTLYDDVELVALLSADLDRARAFVAHELGALAGSSPAIARLRETAGWPSGASSSRRR